MSDPDNPSDPNDANVSGPGAGAPGGPWSVATEAGRLGVSLAGRIAHEFSRLIPPQLAGPATGAGSSASAGAMPGSDDFHRSLRTARLDVERALDGVMDVLGEALDSYSVVVEEAVATAGAPSGPSVETVVIRVTPGASATTPLWIHNTTDHATPAGAIHATAFVAHDRGVLDADIDVDPPLVDPVEPGASASAAIRIEARPDASAGTYHGMVLVEGIDEVALHAQVIVEPPAPQDG